MSLTWYINVYSELTFTYWPYSKHTINKKAHEEMSPVHVRLPRQGGTHLEGQAGPWAMRPQL